MHALQIVQKSQKQLVTRTSTQCMPLRCLMALVPAAAARVAGDAGQAFHQHRGTSKHGSTCQRPIAQQPSPIGVAAIRGCRDRSCRETRIRPRQEPRSVACHSRRIHFAPCRHLLRPLSLARAARPARAAAFAPTAARHSRGHPAPAADRRSPPVRSSVIAAGRRSA